MSFELATLFFGTLDFNMVTEICQKEMKLFKSSKQFVLTCCAASVAGRCRTQNLLLVQIIFCTQYSFEGSAVHVFFAGCKWVCL